MSTEKTMFCFDPSIVVRDLAGKPFYIGEVQDGDGEGEKWRKMLLDLQTEVARCDHKDATQEQAASVPAREEDLKLFLEEHTPKLTLGIAVIEAMSRLLRTKLSDEKSIETLSPEAVVANFAVALEVSRATAAGELVYLSKEQWKTVQARVPRARPDPSVIHVLTGATKPVPMKPAPAVE